MIQTHINRLGGTRRFTNSWTPADERFLRENFRLMGWRFCAKALNRTKGSVLGKAKDLGLSGRWVLVYDEPKDDTNEV